MFKTLIFITFLTFLLLILPSCSDSNNNAVFDETTSDQTDNNENTSPVDIPETIQQQYTLIYEEINTGAPFTNGIEYLGIIASDGSLTIDTTVFTNVIETDLFATGEASITWVSEDGVLNYVLSTLEDGSFNEINVFDVANLTNNFPTFIGQFSEK